MKKLVAAILLVCICHSSLSNNILALDSYHIENAGIKYTTSITQKSTQYLISILPDLLCGIDESEAVYLNTAANVKLGEPFKTYTIGNDVNLYAEQLNDGFIYLYPVYCDGNIEYIITSILYDGNYSITIDRDFAAELNNYIKNNNTNQYILCVEDGITGQRLYALNNSENITDISCTSNYVTRSSNIVYNSVKLMCDQYSPLVSYYINPENKIYDISQNITMTNESKSLLRGSGELLYYPIIGQYNQSICWAASTASMTNYLNSTSFSATGIISDFNTFSGSTVATDYITYTYFKSVFFPYYFPYYTNYTILSNGPTNDFVKNEIDDGNPIIMSAYYFDETNYEGINYHITVLYGYNEPSSADRLTINFMDPYGGTNHQGSKRTGFFSSIDSYYAYTWGGSSTIFRLWKKAITIW